MIVGCDIKVDLSTSSLSSGVVSPLEIEEDWAELLQSVRGDTRGSENECSGLTVLLLEVSRVAYVLWAVGKPMCVNSA